MSENSLVLEYQLNEEHIKKVSNFTRWRYVNLLLKIVPVIAFLWFLAEAINAYRWQQLNLNLALSGWLFITLSWPQRKSKAAEKQSIKRLGGPQTIRVEIKDDFLMISANGIETETPYHSIKSVTKTADFLQVDYTNGRKGIFLFEFFNSEEHFESFTDCLKKHMQN